MLKKQLLNSIWLKITKIFRGVNMKKVSWYISVRPLGCYDFEFYVDDNATEEEIKQEIDNMCEYSMYYDVEEGYEEYTEVRYRKKSDWQ